MKKSLLTIVLSFLVFLSSCSVPSTNSTSKSKVEYKVITSAEAKKLLEENSIILDVRTQEEYNDIRILNAQLLPLDEIDKNAQKQLPDKDQTIIVYCRSGRRSKEAAEKLIEMGYTNVYDLGGINNWEYETKSGKE